jgi:hypothetical protein
MCTWSAEFLPLPKLNPLEQDNFNQLKQELAGSIKKGIDFANKQ